MSSSPNLSWTGSTLAGTASAPLNGSPTPDPKRWQPIDALSHTQQAESHSRFLHVVEQGAMVRRAGTRVLVTKKDAVLLEVPSVKLQGVLVYGNVQVTTQCLRNLLDEGVWLSFFTRNGVYKGRLQPPVERGGRLRLQQWERSRDAEFCLNFGRAVVRAKILAQKQNAIAYSKNYLAETLGDGHALLHESLERLETVKALDELRGVEGNASRAYFDLFRRWNRSEMRFEGREKRGASDPINVLLNFGYTMLTRELEGFLEAAGLDPTIGLYHLPNKDRPSLACDWVEEFRHDVVDRLVLRLINHEVIKSGDFEDLGDRGLRLTADGLRKFLRAYERVLLGKEPAADDTPAPGFRNIFLDQLGRFLDCLNASASYRSHLEQ